MDLAVLHRFERYFLLLAVIFLPITGSTAKISKFLGSEMSNWFLGIGLLLLIYEFCKYGCSIPVKFKYFIVIFTVWQIICLAFGLYFYKFDALLTLDQSPVIAKILSLLNQHGFYPDETCSLKLWLFLRFTKDILIKSNLVFYVSFYVYHLYKNNYKEGISDIGKAVLTLVIIMGVYSLIELAWLKTGSVLAEYLLKTINPVIYKPATSHGWWPPLLWKGQLRSITPEPSFFGIISVFALPFLWNYIANRKNWMVYVALTTYFELMIFATNSRTALFFTCFEFFLLIVLTLLNRTRKAVKTTSLILAISVFAFLGNLALNQYGANLNSNAAASIKEDTTVVNYYKKNLGSLGNKNARSNGARLINLIANLKTIESHPVLGVGTGLKDAYIDENLPADSFTNGEVLNWSKYMHERGVLKSGFPPLNKYVDVAVADGVVGLLMFLSPYIYIASIILKNCRAIFNNWTINFVIISLLAFLGTWMGSVMYPACAGLLLGLLYCFVKENGFAKEN